MIEERHFLGALQLAEAMGDAKSLDSGLARYQSLARSSDPATQCELSRLRAVSDAWTKVESEYGAGSLLNLDHPLIPRDFKLGLISTDELANARQYRDGIKVLALAESAQQF